MMPSLSALSTSDLSDSRALRLHPALRHAHASSQHRTPPADSLLRHPLRNHAQVLLRLLRCVPHARQHERAQSAQQRPQPPAQCASVLRADLQRPDTASHQQHHGCVQRRGPGKSAVCRQLERRVSGRAHGAANGDGWTYGNADAWRNAGNATAVYGRTRRPTEHASISTEWNAAFPTKRNASISRRRASAIPPEHGWRATNGWSAPQHAVSLPTATCRLAACEHGFPAPANGKHAAAALSSWPTWTLGAS